MSSQNGHLAVVKYLIKEGANVNQADKNGVTPLFMSAQNGHLEVVEYLIENGANVNQGTKNGKTALAVAICNDHTSVAKFVLKKDANIETTKLVLKNYGLSELIDTLDKLCNKIKE